MQTPALKTYLDQVGKVVHYLNTIAVGLSAVESGSATKPKGLDVSWAPADPIASGRQARSFVLRATLVMVAEELDAYISSFAGSPASPRLEFSGGANRADKFSSLVTYFGLPNDHLVLGPMLLIHWRNRIIHRGSNAGLTKAEREQLIEQEPILKTDYKNLEPRALLEHFERNSPTLKDVSSLVAMTINCVKAIEAKIPDPASESQVMQWIEHLGFAQDLERVSRVAAAKGKVEVGVRNFIRTHCPSLEDPYFRYCSH